jgi:hypothetical protein
MPLMIAMQAGVVLVKTDKHWKNKSLVAAVQSQCVQQKYAMQMFTLNSLSCY